MEIFRVPSTGDFFLVSDDFRIAGRTFRGAHRDGSVVDTTPTSRHGMGKNGPPEYQAAREIIPLVCAESLLATGSRLRHTRRDLLAPERAGDLEVADRTRRLPCSLNMQAAPSSP